MPKYQGLGFGKQLMNKEFELVNDFNITKFFCNFRYDKITFYKKYDLLETGKILIKSGKKIVEMQLYV